ncbi:hypothetical protein K439DRAFT_1661910 [Ramaria rubella]|nr:hypothetical protein K439DRAFT_1661910 [Ramaria rubella]
MSKFKISPIVNPSTIHGPPSAPSDPSIATFIFDSSDKIPPLGLRNETRFLPRKWEKWELNMLLAYYDIDRCPDPVQRRVWAHKMNSVRFDKHGSEFDVKTFAEGFKDYDRRVGNWFKNQRAKEKNEGRRREEMANAGSRCRVGNITEETSRATTVEMSSFHPQEIDTAFALLNLNTSRATTVEMTPYHPLEIDIALALLDLRTYKAHDSSCDEGDRTLNEVQEEAEEPYRIGASGYIMSISFPESSERGKWAEEEQ